MPPTVPERLRELEIDVRDLRVQPAAAVRARGRQRAHRRLTVLAVAGAVVAVTAGFTAVRTVDRPDRPIAAVPPAPRVECVLTLPDSPAAVRVRVLDGGAPAGLLGTATAQLRARSFTVLTGVTGGGPADVATLRYGPAAIGAATLLRAEVRGEVGMEFDPGRQDQVVDLTIGPAFTRLATTTEVNEGLVAAGEPSRPAQCSAVAPPSPTA